MDEVGVMESYVKLGDKIEKDDIICVLELDKISIDIRAEKSGFITNLHEALDNVNLENTLMNYNDANVWVATSNRFFDISLYFLIEKC